MMRVVVESPCEKCGNTHVGERIVDVGCFGSGGSRRVLTPGEFVLVEKVDGEWPWWALRMSSGTDLVTLLDALAVEEG